LGLSNHSLFTFNIFQKSWGYYGHSRNKPEFITINRRKEVYSVDGGGIYNTSTRKKIKTKDTMFGFPYWRGLFFHPDYAYRSSDEKLWLTQGHGEFGTSHAVLDMKADTFYHWVNEHKFFDHIQSFFEDDRGHLFSTHGLQHLGVNMSDIWQKRDTGAVMVLNNYDFADTSKHNSHRTLFIGGGTYNVEDNKIYFFSQKGFKKGAINPQTGRIEQLEHVFSTKLSWYGESLALGTKMSVRKMEFWGRKLVFLTVGNGIGIYDLDKPDVVQFLR
jgi:hypothetical protein